MQRIEKKNLKSRQKNKIYSSLLLKRKKIYSIISPKYRLFQKYIQNTSIKKFLTIKILWNNIFCSLSRFDGKTLITQSAGQIGTKVTKRSVKKVYTSIVSAFLKKSKKKISKEIILCTLLGNKKKHKFIMESIILGLKKNKYIMHTPALVPFNGCMSKKMKNYKKHTSAKNFRIFSNKKERK